MTCRKLGRWEYAGAYLSLSFLELSKILGARAVGAGVSEVTKVSLA